MLARRTGALVVVGSDRCAAAAAAAAAGATVIVADDGLQHYRLQRDVELVVVDGAREFGNGHLLPAGPLREPLNRLNDVDYVIRQVGAAIEGDCFWLTGDRLQSIDDARQQPLAALAGQCVVAMAGVGNPARFFERLRQAGLNVVAIALDDHAPGDDYPLDDYADMAIIVTEKDAVKLRDRQHPSLWYLPVAAQPSATAEQRLDGLLAHASQQR